MLTTFARLTLVAGMGLAAAACQGDGYGQPSGYQPAYNNGYYAPPPPPRYAYSQPAPNYYYNQNQAYYGNRIKANTSIKTSTRTRASTIRPTAGATRP